jgi:hypothetical protein
MISTLLALALLVFLPLALPLVLIGLVLRLVLLPLKIVGFALRLVFKVLFGVFGLAFALLAVGAFVVLLPLLPLLFIAGGIWLVARAVRPRPVMVAVARRA